MTNVEEHTCPECGEPVVTAWSDQGLLPGDYILFDDHIFHLTCVHACVDAYLERFARELMERQER